MEGDDPAYKTYYWMKQASPIKGSDNTEKMRKEVFGETDITDITDIGVIFAAERGNGDRLCFSPPVIFGKQPRFNIQIGKSNIFDTALVP